MKTTLTILLLSIILISCKKEYIEPEVVIKPIKPDSLIFINFTVPKNIGMIKHPTVKK